MLRIEMLSIDRDDPEDRIIEPVESVRLVGGAMQVQYPGQDPEGVVVAFVHQGFWVDGEQKMYRDVRVETYKEP